MRRNFHFLGELTDEGLVEHDRDEVRQVLLDLEGALYQLGGRVSIASVRQQIGEDAYVTTGMVVTYDSYAPARPRDEDEARRRVAEETVEDGSPEPA